LAIEQREPVCTARPFAQVNALSAAGANRCAIEIVPATIEHAGRIDLRPGDAREIEALGVGLPEAVEMSMSRAVWADAYLLDGAVAALVGVSVQSILGGEGVPWLLTGTPVDRCKRDFLRLTKAGVARMRRQFPVLTNFVHADYLQSLRWLRWLGFTIAPAQPFGINGALFHRATLRTP